MSRDTIRYVRSCSVCAMSSTPRHLPVGKLVPLPIPQRPWSHMGIDFVTDLPESEGKTCMCCSGIAVDRFSKACKLIPLKGLPSALETAEHLFQQVFRKFGVPEDIVSDRGPQFISHVWKAFFRLLGVTVSLSSGYHPQTNGQTERKIQELGRYLRAYCQEDKHSWSRFLPWAEYAQNSLRQNTTGLTPFQCILGYQPPLFPWTGEPSEVPAVDHWFRASERVWDSAHIHLQRAVRRHKDFADVQRAPTPLYHPGDRVWLSTRDIRLRLPCKKLSLHYIGPFKIQRQINEVTYRLQLPPRYRIHPTFHVSLLKPCSSPTPDQHEPPPPEILDQPSVYQVRNIMDSQRRGGQLEYLVDCEGYGPEEQSWVARDDILDPMLLQEFHNTHPNRPAPRGRGCPLRCVRASGAAPGGGGSVRESQSQSSPPTTITRSQSPEFWSPAPALLISTSKNTTCSLTLIVRSTVHYPEQYLTHLSLVATTNLYCCLPETTPAILLCVRPVSLCLPAPRSPKIELPAPRSLKIELPAPRSPKKGTLINTPSEHPRLDSPPRHAPAPITFTVLHY